MTMDGPDFVFTLNDQIRVIARRVGKLFYIDLYDLKEMFAKDKVGIVHKVHNVVKTDGREGFTYSSLLILAFIPDPPLMLRSSASQSLCSPSSHTDM